jgi:DNA-binding NtrC family response regulator
MLGLLIADQDIECRKQMAELFIEAGYNVIVTNSAADALDGILKKSVQVVLLGSEFDKLKAAEMIPLLRQCNRDLTIILISADTSLPLIRKLRNEGIFYHALKPMNVEDKEEIRKAVECAFERLKHNQATKSIEKS